MLYKYKNKRKAMRQDGAVEEALPAKHKDYNRYRKKKNWKTNHQMKKIHLAITKRAKKEA